MTEVGTSDSDNRTVETGAPTDLEGGMPATDGNQTVAGLTTGERTVLRQIADSLIPAAHGMPSAAEIVTDDRLAFVLRARPDLLEPLKASLRPELSPDVPARLEGLKEEPTNVSALQLTIVAGYYTDKRVKELIGYPGQMAIDVKSWLVPPYIEEGLIDAVLARGATWRDPSTGQRIVVADAPHTYAERFTSSAPQGENDGRDGA
ncbi:MAG TPA: hypothetical protein VMZ66_14825 [Aeromicrobium sp.]|nr:hypothetical protein [Aeromicrobium sp.]